MNGLEHELMGIQMDAPEKIVQMDVIPIPYELRQTIKSQQIFLLKSLSYSNALTLHSCPKRYQIDKLGGLIEEDEDEAPGTVHFAFGHALGAALQTLFIPGKTKNDALLAAFIAWNVPIWEELSKKKKSFWYVLRAIDLAEHLVAEIQAEGWEIAQFNDRPAVEYSFLINLPNDFRFAAHVDLILYHRERDVYRVIEVKTSGFNQIHEAVYGNSSQALSYSLVLDYIAKHHTTYDVLYIVYSCPSMQFYPLPYSKSHLAKAEWIRDILYDCETVDRFIATDYFPKRGESCYSFFRPCPYYGACGYSDSYLGVENPTTLAALVVKEKENTKIDKHNKKGYDLIITLEELVRDRLNALHPTIGEES